MIMVAYMVGDQVKVDVYNSDKASVFNRAGFIEIKDGHEIVASYNPNLFICARKINPADLPQPPIPRPARQPAANQDQAPTPETKEDAPETVHPSDRPEVSEDSADRGSAG